MIRDIHVLLHILKIFKVILKSVILFFKDVALFLRNMKIAHKYMYDF